MTVIEAIPAGKGGAGMKAVTQGGLTGFERRRDLSEERRGGIGGAVRRCGLTFRSADSGEASEAKPRLK